MKNVKVGHKVPVVCLDAGHYGQYNSSPVIPEYYESEMNWKLHLLLKTELESYGIIVRQTRQFQDKDLNEYYRGTASEDADLCLSIHSNAAERESADHAVVYVPLSGAGDELGKNLAACISRVMRTTEPQRVARREGANGDYYGVIRGAAAVGTLALILEHSFHTNTRATRWLLSEENLARLAQAEAEVVAQWFDLTEQTKRWYRIRISWDAPETQTAAYQVLENAITACPVGYTVFDWEGRAVYSNFPQESSYELTLPQLKFGDQSEIVRAVQILLEGRGYPNSYGADGIFGTATLQAATKYQRANGLEPDGVVGENTMRHLLGL